MLASCLYCLGATASKLLVLARMTRAVDACKYYRLVFSTKLLSVLSSSSCLLFERYIVAVLRLSASHKHAEPLR